MLVASNVQQSCGEFPTHAYGVEWNNVHFGRLIHRLEQIAGSHNTLKKQLDALDVENPPSKPGPYARALQACGASNSLSEGRRVHGLIIRARLQNNLILGNHIVQMYGNCGSVQEADEAFHSMPAHNSVSWNSIIAAYAQSGDNMYSLYLFRKMQQDGTKVDRVTFIHILGACRDLSDGRKIHSFIQEFGIESDVVLATAILSMYNRCHSLENAREVFDKMKSRSTVSWTAMLTAYAQHGHSKEAVRMFKIMQQEGIQADNVSYIAILMACSELEQGKFVHSCLVEAGYSHHLQVGNALVDMYGRCGALEQAREIFHKLPHRNVVTWTVLITAHSQHGQDREALKLFLRMQQEGIKPDSVTLLSMLDVCGNTSSLFEGKMVHSCIVESGLESASSFGNAIASMYAKCGSLRRAEDMFVKVVRQDCISWTSLITAYARHGDSDEALGLFMRMKQAGVDPDEVTYVSVLSVCSHAGLLSEACQIFYAMVRDDELEPNLEQCGCIAGLLGRAGWLKEAEEFIRKVATKVQNDPGMWIALLGACEIHGDARLGKHAAGRIMELDPKGSSGYVVFSNIERAS